jgi:hypothetical protein
MNPAGACVSRIDSCTRRSDITMTIPAGVMLENIHVDTPFLNFALGSGWHRQLTISADTVSFTLTFSESPAGLAPSDFTIETSGTATAEIADVSVSFVTGPAGLLEPLYHVTVDHIGGNGTFTLELADPEHLDPLATYYPITVDTTPPELLATRFLSGPGDYHNGAQLTFEVDFNEPIAVAGGVPSLLLSNGGEALYTGGSGTGRLLFTYTVAPNQLATDDLAIVGFDAHGATTHDVAGNDVDWSALNVVDHATVSVDPDTVTAPRFASLTVSSPTAKAGDTVIFTLTSDDPFEYVYQAGDAPPTLTLSNGAVAQFVGIGNGAITFAHVVSADEANGPLTVASLDMNTVVVRSPSSNGFGIAQPIAVTSDSALLRPTSVYLADLDGDGNNDLVTLSWQQHKISVLLGHGDGTFDAAVNYDVGVDANGALDERQRAAIVADVNGDGILDIAAAGLGSVSVLIGNGDGTFAAPVRTPINDDTLGFANLYKLSVIDLGAEGTRLVVDGARTFQKVDTDGTNFDDFINYTTINVFRSDALGHLTLDNTLGGVPIAGGIDTTLIDVNGDGRLDLAGASYANEAASGYEPPAPIFFQDPVTGQMVEYQMAKLLEAVGRIAVTYGIDDMSYSSVRDGVSSPWGDGNGAVYAAFDARILPKVTTAARLEGGLTSIIAAGEHMISVSTVNADGSFDNCVYYTDIVIPLAVKTVDINGDGALDIVVAGFDENVAGLVAVYYNLGDAHFLAAQQFPIDGFGVHNFNPSGRSRDAVAFGDVDGDGRPDMVTVAPDGGVPGVTLYVNRSTPNVAFDVSSLAAVIGQASVVVDTLAPAAPKIALLHDTGLSASDRLTGDATLLVTPAESGGTILYKVNGAADFSAAAPHITTDGTHTVVVAQQDDAGNIGAQASLIFTLDTVAPTAGAPVKLAAIAQDSGAHIITTAELTFNAHDDHALVVTDLKIASGAGTLVDQQDGTWTFTPAAHDDTSVSFGYQISDGVNAVAATATLDIVPPAQNIPITRGTTGDDTFTASPGSQQLDAAGGVDTIVFGFKLTDARLSFSDNQVTVDGPDGSHAVLSGFEVFKFLDGTVNNNDGNPLVDDLFYFANNHDVWQAGVDPDAHYAAFGWREGRDPNAFFSTSGYLSVYADVKAAGVNPLMHYDQFGWREGRDPSPQFDTAGYLAANADVKTAGIDPLAHFLLWGEQEARHAVGDGHFG